jgi:hypothetical protein
MKPVDNGGPENLLCGHALGACRGGWVLVADQVLRNLFADGRLSISDVPDDFHLLGLGMSCRSVHQRHLYFYEFLLVIASDRHQQMNIDEELSNFFLHLQVRNPLVFGIWGIYAFSMV